MKYKIIGTEKANEQLRRMIFYIEGDFGSVDTALNYLEKLEKEMNLSGEFPLSGSTPKYSILRKQRYRVLMVERHLVFYKVNENEKTVIIYAVLDSRKEYKNLI